MLLRHNAFQRWNCDTCTTLWWWVKLLNFTKAAARLRVAQPALSRQIQDLEDEIGVDLTAI
jgi:DNA-binding transcriptional LysR family regulator